MSIKATQPEDSAVTDEQILALNADERFFSESPTKYPESGHGTQYHAGAPGVIGFARAVLALATPSPQPAAEPTIRERDMAMMIRRIVSKARRHCEDDSPVLKLANEAWGLMLRLGMQGSPLRDESPQPAEAKTAAVDGDAKHGDTDGLR